MEIPMNKYCKTISHSPFFSIPLPLTFPANPSSLVLLPTHDIVFFFWMYEFSLTVRIPDGENLNFKDYKKKKMDPSQIFAWGS